MRATTILFIIAFCLFLNYETKAQCCPYINYVEILPENPMSNESIILVTSITTSNLGCFLESNLTSYQNTPEPHPLSYRPLHIFLLHFPKLIL